MLKIPIHSTTDLITNSSTVIFTYSENSENAIVEMIDEVFKTFGVHKKCKDVFDTVVLSEKYQYTEEYVDEYSPDEMTPEQILQLYDDVKAGKVEKPEWFNEIESHEDWSYYTPSTFLHLIPKKEEYKKLAELIKKFLYSPNHEASNDG